MDHYNEQMIQKQTQPKDVALRILIIAAALIIVGLSAYTALLFGFLPLILVGAGAIYLGYILFCNTFVEYEYIVTNNDLDIDRISGKRKRKRLITLKLNTVKEWGEYTGKEGSGVSATVMATDASGYGAWYIIADHAKLGKIMILFTPIEETVGNINFGVPHGVKKRLDVKKTGEETEEETE